MNTDEILEKVRDFADRAHGDQMRKYTPERYIVHPVRVMKLCREYNQDVRVLSAALLHDVLEDTPVDREEMLGFLKGIMPSADALKVLGLVVELTDVYIKKDYPYLNRTKRKQLEAERIAKTSRDAQTIKYADMIDNCTEIIEHDPDFAVRFLSEYKNIIQRIPKGDPRLYERAVKTVEEGIGLL